MIKLKDILFESTAPDIFVPRRINDRAERLIMSYIRNGSKGDLILHRMGLTELPESLNGISVERNFSCIFNELTTLKNCPKRVGSSFYVSFNKLTSLEGAPEYVGEGFHCDHNPVKFTEEQVRALCDVRGKMYV